MARDFNGTTDRIDYSSAFNTTGQALTVAGWFRFDDDTPAATQYLWSSELVTGLPGTLLAQGPSASRRLFFARTGGTQNKYAETITGYFGATGTWYHIAVGDDGAGSSNVDFYINGVKTNVAVSTGLAGGESTANSGFILGGRTSDDLRNFNGAQEHPAVYNRKLSDAEILSLAKRRPPTTLSGLKFYARLEGDDYKNIIDQSGTLDGTSVTASSGLLTYRQRIGRLGVESTVQIPSLSTFNGGTYVYEGQTGVTLTGVRMNASGAGARIRVVGDGSAYDALTSYSASDASNATATIPTLSRVPFSQNAAGVGLTTWNVEAVGTQTPTGYDPATVSVEVRPASGWDVVEIATPDLTDASLLYYLGWTGVATDLLHWTPSVVVGAITVAITVNDDGTYSYVSTYTSGGAPAPLPNFSWQYRAYDSASKLWTSLGTVHVTTTSGSGLSMSALRRRRR